MKLFKKLSALLTSIVLIVSCFAFVPVNASTGYTIDHYDVHIVAEENGIYTITETLDVHFNRSMHGIYLNIASKYENYSWNVDGQQIIKDYRFPVSNVDVLSDQKNEIDYSLDGVQIIFGSSNYYADEYETYKVTYQVHTRDLGLNGIQSFYYNIISNDWDAPIESATFTIEMPKSFDANNLYFYTNYTDVDPELQYSVSGNTITGSLNKEFTYGTGITIKLDLPNDYFVYENTNEAGYIIIGISILLVALFYFIFNKYGRDDKVVQTVEFKAPKELTSAGCGYIIDGVVDNRDVISLILDWANKGYITIKDEKSNLILHKITPLPSDAHNYEVTFFNALFPGDKDEVSTDDITDMYQSFIDTKDKVKSHYEYGEHKIFSTESSGYQALTIFLASLPLSCFGAYCIWIYTYVALATLFPFLFTEAFLIIGTALLGSAVKHWHTGSHRFTLLVIGFVLCLFGFMIPTIALLIAKICSLWVILALVIITMILILLATFMSKRTKFGVDMLGKVLGLRDFIKTAEGDRLKALVEEDPQIFYHVLPYAYAFNLTDVWSKHFENITIPTPEWYYGSDRFNYVYFYNNMTHGLHNASNPIPPVTVSEGGGGGFGGGGFGGGFGGGGGGGFSGGGFGGSHGGGW